MITLVSCFALSSFGMGQLQSTLSISNSGTIKYYRSYVCGNYNSTHYYAQNNVTGVYERISSDATSIISYALNSLSAGRTWKEQVVLDGNFSLNTRIYIPSYTILRIQGTLTTSSTSTPLIIAGGSSGAHIHFIEIHGGSVKLPSGTIWSAIWLYCTDDALIEGVDARGCTAVRLEVCNRINVTQCNLTAIESGACVLLDTSNDIFLLNNRISGTPGKKVQTILTQGDPVGCKRVTIQGNDITQWGDDGGCHGAYIGIAATSDITIIDNDFHDAQPNSGNAIRFDGSNGYIARNKFRNLLSSANCAFIGTALTTSIVSNVTVTNNTVQNVLQGFLVYAYHNNVSGISILANTISGCIEDGVTLYGESGSYVEKCTIADNVIYNCTSHGILLSTETSDNTVTRNHVSGCGTNILDEGIGNHVYNNTIG